MSWRTVAVKDFRDSIRSKTIWIIILILTVGITVSLFLFRSAENEESLAIALNFLTQFTTIVVPLIALISSYLSISGEVESGSMKLLLGMPITRGEIILGKFFGRSLTVVSGILLSFLIGFILSVWFYGGFYLYEWTLFFLLTSFLALSFTGLGVGISSIVGSNNKSMILAITGYLGLVFFWNTLINSFHYLLFGEWSSEPHPDWFNLLLELNPASAYEFLVSVFLESINPIFSSENFLNNSSLVLVLLIWIIIPLLIGYLRFRRKDL